MKFNKFKGQLGLFNIVGLIFGIILYIRFLPFITQMAEESAQQVFSINPNNDIVMSLVRAIPIFFLIGLFLAILIYLYVRYYKQGQGQGFA